MSTSSEFGWQYPGSDPQSFEYPSVSQSRIGKHGRGVDINEAAKEMLIREQRAREEGIREGEASARRVFEEGIRLEREKIATALLEFAGEREGYFRRVETEVVRLALAIARKILHREAQLDPLLLAGIVRVTLQKIGEGTKVQVRVNPACSGQWRTYFATCMELRCVPEIVEDGMQPVHACVLETELGTTEVSLETQLKEIESGFFDLLAQKAESSE